MFISNLHNAILGIDGRLNLAVGEINHYIDDSNIELVTRVKELESAKLVSISNDPGLVKTGITGNVVKAVSFDAGAVSNGPRSAAKAAPKQTPEPPVVQSASKLTKTTRTRKATPAPTAEEATQE